MCQHLLIGYPGSGQSHVPLSLAACIAAALCACQDPDFGTGPVSLSPGIKASFEEYKARDAPLYFVITEDGRGSSYIYCAGGFNCTASTTRAIALDRCRSGYPGHDCKLYAIGRNVVWQGAEGGARPAPELSASDRLVQDCLAGQTPSIRSTPARRRSRLRSCPSATSAVPTMCGCGPTSRSAISPSRRRTFAPCSPSTRVTPRPGPGWTASWRPRRRRTNPSAHPIRVDAAGFLARAQGAGAVGGRLGPLQRPPGAGIRRRCRSTGAIGACRRPRCTAWSRSATSTACIGAIVP